MFTSAVSSTWLSIRPTCAPIQTRLFCFPHAGGSPAAFRAWPDKLSSSIELRALQLPGRGSRLREEPFDSMPTLIRSIEEDIDSLLDKPFVFYGHSLGALIAFELTRSLRKRGMEPVHLFVSGMVAPQYPDPNEKIHHLPLEVFLQKLQSLNGLPQHFLESPELLEIFLPSLLADIHVVESYQYIKEEPLPCPVTLFGGDRDPRTCFKGLQAWQEQTQADFRFRLFPGNHFFNEPFQDEILRIVRESLDQR